MAASAELFEILSVRDRRTLLRILTELADELERRSTDPTPSP